MFQTYTFAQVLQVLKNDVREDLPLVFDCDGTLLDGDVSSITGWLLMRDGLVDQHLIPEQFHSADFYTQMSLLDYERVRATVELERGALYVLEWEVFIQSGLPHAVVVDYARRALDLALKKQWVTMETLCPKVLTEFRDQSWIVSGSSKPTVQALAHKLGVPEQRVIATELEVVDGIYMPRFAEPGFIWQEGKRHSLEKCGITHPYFVAGDSVGDWHMMQMSTHWIWCVMWHESRFRAKSFRDLLEEKLEIGAAIPRQPGIYSAPCQGRNWIFEVKAAATGPHPLV